MVDGDVEGRKWGLEGAFGAFLGTLGVDLWATSLGDKD